MVQRVTYRRKNTYNTRSNKIRQIRTPGGKLAVQYVKKRAAAPKPYLNKLQRLGGLHRLRPGANKRASTTSRKVNRPYGGYFTAGDLKDRIVRAFITEEVKEVKKKLLKNAQAPKKSKKSKKTKKKRRN